VAAAAFAALLFHDFWTPDVFLAGHDTFTHDYLMWDWGWKSLLETRHVPLWNPYLFGGWPFVASFAFCPFYPPAWVSILLPTSLALTSQYALHLVIGAVGFYILARSLPVSCPAAFLTALLYAGGAHVATLAFPGHLAKVQAIAWVPWAIATAVVLARRPGFLPALGLAAAWALQLLASHAQIFYATFCICLLYVGACRLARWLAREPGHARVSLRAILFFAVAGALMVGLSAVQMVPAIEMARISNRSGGVDIETASFGGLPPEEILELALPSFRGDSTLRNDSLCFGGFLNDDQPVYYLGRWHAGPDGGGAERLVSDYAGIWAVLLALAGVFLARDRKRWFFLGVFVLSVGISTGAFLPFFKFAHFLVPGLSRFRSPATFMIGAHLALFVLAALGTEAALRQLRDRGRRFYLKAAGTAIGLGVIAATAVILLVRLHAALDPGLEFDLDHAESLARRVTWLYMSRSLLHVLVFFTGGCFALALGALAVWKAPRKRALILLLLAFLAVALLDGGTQIRRFLPRDRTQGLETFLSPNWVDDSVLRTAGNDPLPTMISENRELSNRPMMIGIRSVHGYHPVVYGDYQRLLDATGFFYSLTTSRLFAQNYYELNTETPVPDGWHVLRILNGRKLIARDTPIPLAQVPQKVTPIGRPWEDLSVEEWRERIGSADFRPELETWCGGDYAWSIPENVESVSNALAVNVHMVRPGQFHLSWQQKTPKAKRARAAHADTQGLIPCLLAVPAGAGWRVGLGSIPMASLREWGWPRRVNGFFLLAPLEPESDYPTVLTYSPAGYRIGGSVTLLTLLALALILMADSIRRKTSPVSD